MRFLRKNIESIFIILGTKCNMSCRYCLQRPLVQESPPTELNPEIYDFIEEISMDSNSLNIQFYGGEPLLYFPLMKEIKSELNKRQLNATYSLISNGKLLNDEIVEWCNTNNVVFNLSWDADGTPHTRIYDVIKEKKDIVMKIQSLGITSVISGRLYPIEACDRVQELVQEYFRINNKYCGVNFDQVMNTGDLPDDIMMIDEDRIKSEMKQLLIQFLRDNKNNTLDNSKWYAHYQFVEKILSPVLFNIQHNNAQYNHLFCSCLNGYRVLNLGVDGSLYPCHNTNDKCGDIWMPFFEYLENVEKTDRTRINNYTCNQCIAAPYCCGGCKLVQDREWYCRHRKALIEPIIERILEEAKN